MSSRTITKMMYTHTETVAILSQELGTPVAWGAWLQDLRRPSRADRPPKTFHGLVLLPGGATANARGLPLYEVDEVISFIDAAKAADPGMTVSPKGQLYSMDAATSALTKWLGWRFCRAAPL